MFMPVRQPDIPFLLCAMSVWLYSSGVGSLTFVVDRALYRHHIGVARTWVHASVTSCIVALNAALWGLPEFGITRTTLFFLVGGAGVGFVYYFVERVRLALTYGGYILRRQPSDWGGRTSGSRFGEVARTFTPVVLVAIAEEMLFRWYVINAATELFAVSLVQASLVSALAYAVLHNDDGVGTIVSRGLFGLLLGLVVVVTGRLSFAVIAHVTYNAAVYAYPVLYKRVKHAL